MAKGAELTEISDTVYGCSVCKDFKIELIKLEKKTPTEWEARLKMLFAEHSKRRHPGEDFSQADAGSQENAASN